jgi:hypothetical protein
LPAPLPSSLPAMVIPPALTGDGSPRFKLSRDPALCHRRRRASSSRFRENFDKPCPRS